MLHKTVVRVISTRTLGTTTSVFADVAIANNSARLVQLTGEIGANLQLAGTIDPRMLQGNIPAGSQIETNLINALNLSISLGKNLCLGGGKPDFLTLGDSTLLIKGVGGKIASSVSTSLAVNVGSGLHFDAVSLNHNPVKQILTIQSSAIAPSGNWLTLQCRQRHHQSTYLHGSIDERNRPNNTFRLDGKYSLTSSAPQDFSISLSGGSPAQYKISGDSDMTLGKLLGRHPPGLDAIALRNVTSGNNYRSAEITLQGLSFDVKGQNSHLGFALSFTDPAFTANQLGALALYVFSQVLQTAAKDGQQLPPGLFATGASGLYSKGLYSRSRTRQGNEGERTATSRGDQPQRAISLASHR